MLQEGEELEFALQQRDILQGLVVKLRDVVSARSRGLVSINLDGGGEERFEDTKKLVLDALRGIKSGEVVHSLLDTILSYANERKQEQMLEFLMKVDPQQCQAFITQAFTRGESNNYTASEYARDALLTYLPNLPVPPIQGKKL